MLVPFWQPGKYDAVNGLVDNAKNVSSRVRKRGGRREGMGRRGGFIAAIARAQREAERQQAAQVRAQAQSARELERAQRAYKRAKQEQQREEARLYAESRQAEANAKNQQLTERTTQLRTLLVVTLNVDDYFELNSLKQQFPLPPFEPGDLAQPESAPVLGDYLPPAQGFLTKLIPGASGKYEREVAAGKGRYDQAAAAHQEQERQRENALAAARHAHAEQVAQIQREQAAQHAEIDDLKRQFAAGDPEAVADYFLLVLETSSYPEDFPRRAKVAYVRESKQLVVEADLPSYDLIPPVESFKYVKAKDEIAPTMRSAAQRKALYASVVAQITLRTLHELFEADRAGFLDSIVYNGYVDAIDAGTGRSVRPCLVTVRTTRDAFLALNLRQVDPIACLKALNASVSKSPAELAPVRPVLEFNMVDPRFVEESDVLSSLDQRPNLMELTPTEFESLITNLFEKMGLETRQTQASRDGGVDCVAYDPRPIFGGKVVIQAKRYKHTVGVSAVRDLFGTMQNEGASKGILVTTSGYGKAAFDFAAGKPLELLAGSNLLYLLHEHAGITAKIEAPDSWRDPVADVEGA